MAAIFLLLLVLVIVVLFVAQPFTVHWRVNEQKSLQISTLLAERERTLNALQELDFDNSLGKVPLEEYSAQRASLIQKGSDILRQLDQNQDTQLHAVEKPVELKATEQHTKLLSDEDLEDLLAQRRAECRQKTAGFCPNCGKPILQSDQFCPSCGQMVNSS